MDRTNIQLAEFKINIKKMDITKLIYFATQLGTTDTQGIYAIIDEIESRIERKNK